MLSLLNRSREYQEVFNKLIKPIEGVDLLDEYVKIRLKISTLSANKRKAVMTHIMVAYNKSEEAREVIDKLDQMIINEVKLNYQGSQLK